MHARHHLIAIIIAAVLAFSPALAGEEKMSGPVQALAKSGNADFVDVIITYKVTPGHSDKNQVGELGGTTKRAFKHLPMRAVRMPANALTGLSHNPNVEFISRDAPVTRMSVSARETANMPSDKIDYDIASSGVGVAVLDSGVGYHVDIWPSHVQYDFVGGADAVPGVFDSWVTAPTSPA